jgi:hypothetical protein
VRRLSFISTLATWVFTVVSLTTSSAAISALERPRAIRRNTSSSRAVRLASAAGGSRSDGSGSREAKRSSSRRVTDGASRASPLATTRIASTRSSGGTSLSRNPLAPARRADTTCSSRSKVMRISTRAGSPVSTPASRLVASIPSMRGMRMSISTTSGCTWAARSTAS